jgi:hypothetical protein
VSAALNIDRVRGQMMASLWISLLRVVLLTAIVLSSQYVGGPVLVALVLSSLVIASVMSRSYGTAFGLCTGIVFSLFVLLIEFMVLVPMLRFFGPTKTLFFDDTWIEPFVARTTTLQHLVELNRTGAIVIALVPLLVAFEIGRASCRERVSVTG